MAKTKKELEALKKEFESLAAELNGLVDEELEFVVGGYGRLAIYDEPGNGTYTVILNQLTAQDNLE